MACTLDATPSGATANSFATIAESDAYHAAHLYASTWDDASEDQRCRALVQATRLLDEWYDWYGVVADTGQALGWPRASAYGPQGVLLASDAIPVGIVNATCELARQLLAKDRTADSDVEAQGLSRLRAGSVELEFRSSVAAKPIPDTVATMLAPYARSRRYAGGAVTLLRA